MNTVDTGLQEAAPPGFLDQRARTLSPPAAPPPGAAIRPDVAPATVITVAETTKTTTNEPFVLRYLSLLSSAKRKEYPIITGCLDYFPDALTMVAHVSYKGNEKHNPGQPLHHARGKSADHLDCIGRHLIERDQIETDDILHLANAAWRALAELQVEMERRYNLSLPRGATAPGVALPSR